MCAPAVELAKDNFCLVAVQCRALSHHRLAANGVLHTGRCSDSRCACKEVLTSTPSYTFADKGVASNCAGALRGDRSQTKTCQTTS